MNIFTVVAILTTNVDKGRLGRDSRSANDDTRDSNQMRDVGGIQVTDGYVRCRGVQEKLVGWKSDVPLAGVDDAASAVLKCRLKLLRLAGMSSLGIVIAPTKGIISAGSVVILWASSSL